MSTGPGGALFAALLSACGLLACSSTPPDDCPKAQPAFHVTLTASDGPLPADTTLRVTYGGQSEEYALLSPPAQPAVVYCTPQYADDADAAADADADAGTRDVVALSCDLWTQAAATIEVQAADYPKLTADLEPDTNDCGIKTVDYPLLLDKGDAGTQP